MTRESIKRVMHRRSINRRCCLILLQAWFVCAIVNRFRSSWLDILPIHRVSLCVVGFLLDFGKLRLALSLKVILRQWGIQICTLPISIKLCELLLRFSPIIFVKLNTKCYFWAVLKYTGRCVIMSDKTISIDYINRNKIIIKRFKKEKSLINLK